MPGTSSLVTTTVSNTKISEIDNKIPDNSKYITTQVIYYSSNIQLLNGRKFCNKIKTS